MWNQWASGFALTLSGSFASAQAEVQVARVNIMSRWPTLRTSATPPDAMTPIQVFIQVDLLCSGATTLREWMGQWFAHAGGGNPLGVSASSAARSPTASLCSNKLGVGIASCLNAGAIATDERGSKGPDAVIHTESPLAVAGHRSASRKH